MTRTQTKTCYEIKQFCTAQAVNDAAWHCLQSTCKGTAADVHGTAAASQQNAGHHSCLKSNAVMTH